MAINRSKLFNTGCVMHCDIVVSSPHLVRRELVLGKDTEGAQLLNCFQLFLGRRLPVLPDGVLSFTRLKVSVRGCDSYLGDETKVRGIRAVLLVENDTACKGYVE
jgi:hypothetical protein